MRRLAPLTLALSLVLASLACAGSDAGSSPAPPAAKLSASWAASANAPFPGSLTGEVVVPASDDATVSITLRNARFTALPSACRQSTIVRARSLIVDGNARLRCVLAKSRSARTIRFAAVTVAAAGDELGGTVRFSAGSPGEVELPAIEVDEAPTTPTRRLRLLSSPDFLNADVGDLARGPGFWTPRRSSNGINAEYRRAIDKVLADWKALEPAGVLVAGDLVDGRWGRDSKGTGNFGPVGTVSEQQRALDLAAATYYPQWLQRFRRHGLKVFPAVGDHEYGDNPWPADKRVLVPRFRHRFAHYFTRTRSGKAEVPRPSEGRPRVHGVRRPAAARRPADHPRPLRHHPRARPDRSRPGPADLAAQRAPQGQARQGAVDHRPGPRADPRAGAPPRLEPTTRRGRRATRRPGSSSRSTASTSTSPARPTT